MASASLLSAIEFYRLAFVLDYVIIKRSSRCWVVRLCRYRGNHPTSAFLVFVIRYSKTAYLPRSHPRNELFQKGPDTVGECVNSQIWSISHHMPRVAVSGHLDTITAAKWVRQQYLSILNTYRLAELSHGLGYPLTHLGSLTATDSHCTMQAAGN